MMVKMLQVSHSLFGSVLPPPPMSAGSITTTVQTQPSLTLTFKPFKPPDGDYDGKRLRKSVMRKTVDYNSSVVQMLEARIWQRDERDRPALPADICYASCLLPPPAYNTNPINAVVTKFVRASTNKAKCPIFCLAWTPEGRRLVTGASSGEFTLWNGLTFNFETILQAHDSSVRTMIWSHNDQWMVTGDTGGVVKYWQSNMNNVKMFQAHKDPVRGLSFSPSDLKLATASDDGTVRIWDFYRCHEERVLRGHGADVKCVDWHPSKSLIASGSKDNQQPIKLWDPRSGSALMKLHAHKNTVMDLKWNANGNWLVSASRDHLLKLFDIRNLASELQVFRGHKKEASCIAWHPRHEGLFASGGSDGSILYWHVGNEKEVGAIESAHDGIIWGLAWHPLGHILCSGSNDHSSKFWTRNRPGDRMRDKYNLNTLPPGVVGDDCVDIDDIPSNLDIAPQPVIPGMGPEDKVEEAEKEGVPESIPGLDFDTNVMDTRFFKKTPYAKPIPKTFQAAWNAAGGLEDPIEEENPAISWVVVNGESLFSHIVSYEGEPFVSDIGEHFPPGTKMLSEIRVDAIMYAGFYIPLNSCGTIMGDELHDAFVFCDEEEAIATITKDPEFARKLMREKRGLINPGSNYEEIPERPNVRNNFRDRDSYPDKYDRNYSNHRGRDSYSRNRKGWDRGYNNNWNDDMPVNSNARGHVPWNRDTDMCGSRMGNAGPNMWRNMGGNMGPPGGKMCTNMVGHMGNMGPNMGNMGPIMGGMSPGMGGNMGKHGPYGPNMGPGMGGNMNMGPNRGGNMGPGMRDNMGPGWEGNVKPDVDADLRTGPPHQFRGRDDEFRRGGGPGKGLFEPNGGPMEELNRRVHNLPGRQPVNSDMREEGHFMGRPWRGPRVKEEYDDYKGGNSMWESQGWGRKWHNEDQGEEDEWSDRPQWKRRKGNYRGSSWADEQSYKDKKGRKKRRKVKTEDDDEKADGERWIGQNMWEDSVGEWED